MDGLGALFSFWVATTGFLVLSCFSHLSVCRLRARLCCLGRRGAGHVVGLRVLHLLVPLNVDVAGDAIPLRPLLHPPWCANASATQSRFGPGSLRAKERKRIPRAPWAAPSTPGGQMESPGGKEGAGATSAPRGNPGPKSTTAPVFSPLCGPSLEMQGFGTSNQLK